MATMRALAAVLVVLVLSGCGERSGPSLGVRADLGITVDDLSAGSYARRRTA